MLRGLVLCGQRFRFIMSRGGGGRRSDQRGCCDEVWSNSDDPNPVIPFCVCLSCNTPSSKSVETLDAFKML